jgi:hypothetical protein
MGKWQSGVRGMPGGLMKRLTAMSYFCACTIRVLERRDEQNVDKSQDLLLGVSSKFVNFAMADSE